MGTMSERQLHTDVTSDIETVGVGILSLVTVGGTHQYHAGRTRRHHLVVQFDVVSDVASGDGGGVFEPENLLDGVGNQ